MPADDPDPRRAADDLSRSAARPLAADELEAALADVLIGARGQRVRREQIDHVLRQVARGAAWTGYRIDEDAAPSSKQAPRAIAICVGLVLPGKAGLMMLPGNLVRSEFVEQAYGAAVEAVCRDLARRGARFAQGVLEPEDRAGPQILARGGFERITSLMYLARSVRYPWVDPPQRTDLDWVTYGNEERGAFESTLAQTYVASADFPELTALRGAADALEAHRATGEFDPQLWNLCRIAGQDVGCVLLNRHADGETLELVYVGVADSARGVGLGRELLRRVLELARQFRMRRIVVAVDKRNEIALRLYRSMGFEDFASREVRLRVLARLDGA